MTDTHSRVSKADPGAIFSFSIQPSRKVSLGLDCLAFTCHLYWWSHTEESLVYRWNHIEISVVYRWSHTKVPLVYRWNHTEVSLVYRWNHTEASLVCRWNHTEVYPCLASYVPGSVCEVHVQLLCCTASDCLSSMLCRFLLSDCSTHLCSMRMFISGGFCCLLI